MSLKENEVRELPRALADIPLARPQASAPGRELTFGEKAVGLTFNHAVGPVAIAIDTIKKSFAATIDLLHQHREEASSPDVKRMLSIAITEAQTAQMWAVKAVTWQH